MLPVKFSSTTSRTSASIKSGWMARYLSLPRIIPSGSLTNKQCFFYLPLVDGSTQSGGDGMTVDKQGWLYVTTEMGLQICDQPGRVEAIIPKPQRGGMSAVAFGGANRDELYVA